MLYHTTLGGSWEISFNLDHIIVSASAAGKTFVIKPIFSASTAVIFWPNNSTSDDFSDPIIRGKVREEQPSGQRPSWVNGVCNHTCCFFNGIIVFTHFIPQLYLFTGINSIHQGKGCDSYSNSRAIEDSNNWLREINQSVHKISQKRKIFNFQYLFNWNYSFLSYCTIVSPFWASASVDERSETFPRSAPKSLPLE